MDLSSENGAQLVNELKKLSKWTRKIAMKHFYSATPNQEDDGEAKMATHHIVAN